MRCPGAGFTSHLQRQVTQSFIEACGVPGVRFDHSRQALSENGSLAGSGLTVEFASVEDDLNRNTTPGQIGQRSGVAAVNTCRRLMTNWTRRWKFNPRKNDRNPVRVGHQTFKFKLTGRQNRNKVESELHLKCLRLSEIRLIALTGQIGAFLAPSAIGMLSGSLGTEMASLTSLTPHCPQTANVTY